MVEALRTEPLQDVAELESRCLSISQQRCVITLFAHWQLPVALSQAACHHHRPDQVHQSRRLLTAVVHLANHVSLLAQEGFSAEPAPAAYSAEVLALVGAAEDELYNIADKLAPRLALFLTASA
jgi:HD-like signal output (HDOD) protein